MRATNDDPGSTFVDQKTIGSIRQMPLDEYQGLRGAGKIALIKIDVEGYECEVLSGARNTIVRSRPTIICEVIESHLSRNGHTPADLFNFFSSIGYAGRLVTDDGLREVAGFVTRGDYVFSPG